MGEHGLLTHLLRLEAEGALFHDGACQHFRAGALGYGDRFACDHRLIDMGLASKEGAIDGDALTGSHLDRVAWLQHGDGGLGNGAVIHQMGGLGL